MLTINGIDKGFNHDTFNEKMLFQDFSLTVNQGDFITIIGSNGAGKSTLLNLIAGDLKVDDGRIVFCDEDITKVANHKRAGVLSRVFQDPSLNVAPNMTIRENLAMASNKHKRFPLIQGVRKKDVHHFKELLRELNLGLDNMLDKKVSLLSGGQRQSLGLIMAIMTKPKLILLDEHTAALDPNTAHTILEITENLVAKHRVTTLMITHNMNDAIKYGNRLIMLDEGKIILDIDSDEKKTLTSERLIDQFKQLKQRQIEDRLVLI